jgi:putative phosphonate metabolism protein
MPERYGIYYAPAVTSPLWSLAAQWLGRDPASGAASEREAGGLPFAARFPLTASARRYGFHATLKAPMALDARLEGKDLDRAIKAWAQSRAPVEIGRLVLQPIDGFLALVPARQVQQLTDFVGDLVADFDGFRAPLEAAERQKRVAGGRLTPRQVELLDQFGYPYVMEVFRFHMTLTDSLEQPELEQMRMAAAEWFAPVFDEPLLLDRLVLYHEAESGAPFRRLRDYPLSGER